LAPTAGPASAARSTITASVQINLWRARAGIYEHALTSSAADRRGIFAGNTEKLLKTKASSSLFEPFISSEICHSF
jgi:hypothetical protein